MGDSMRNLIGLKKMIMFSAVLLTIGSVSAQQAFAGQPSCFSVGDGNWNNLTNWNDCGGGFPDLSTDAAIGNNDIRITGDEKTQRLTIAESGTLFIECDASLFLSEGTSAEGNITNHGTFTAGFPDLDLFGTFFNSGDFSGLNITASGSFVQISTICSQPIGGTVGSMSTTSLLVAGAQANTGLWSLALVGMVAAGAVITYKLKSNKTDKETL